MVQCFRMRIAGEVLQFELKQLCIDDMEREGTTGPLVKISSNTFASVVMEHDGKEGAESFSFTSLCSFVSRPVL